MFWSARASKAASGTRCSPERRTRPEKRPSRKAKARFSVSRSGKIIVTMRCNLLYLAGIGLTHGSQPGPILPGKILHTAQGRLHAVVSSRDEMLIHASYCGGSEMTYTFFSASMIHTAGRDRSAARITLGGEFPTLALSIREVGA